MIVKRMIGNKTIKASKEILCFPPEIIWMWDGITKLNRYLASAENDPESGGEVRYYRLSGLDMNDNVIFDIPIEANDSIYVCNDRGKTIEVIN